MQNQQGEGGEPTVNGPAVDEGRRAALAKMGGLAAPAFIALLVTDASEAWSASGGTKPKPKPKPKPK